MTPSSLITTAVLVRAALVAVVLTGATSQAGAVSLGVKFACASDYYSYCSQHPSGSVAVRQCMRAHGAQLSKRCVNALIAAGEVSKVEVESRRAAKAAKSKTATASAE